ncbi:MAG: tetratricopeptide repeat protein [Geobacter sp.]
MTTSILMETANHDERAVYDRLTAALQGLPPQEAIRRIKEFLATFPSFALAHNDLGVLYHQAGNPTLALAHHEKASRLQPENILFRKNLADFYAVELGWLEEAVDIYLEVVRRNPRDTESLIALGQLGSALAGSRTLEAPLERQQLESTAPSAVNTTPTPVKSEQELYAEAQQMAGQGDLQAARQRLDELVSRQPANALYHNDIGVICYQLSDLEAAQRHYESAHQLQPANATFTRNLADLYFSELNRVDEAIHLYLDLLKAQPGDVETLVNLGHICKAVGREEEAKTFYRRALEVEPWNSEARQSLAASSVAPVQLQSAFQAPTKSIDELLAEARQLSQQGQAAQARQLLEQSIARHPSSAVAHNDLGVVTYSLGDVGAAQAAYEQAVRLDPANSNFRKNLADLYFVAVGRPDDAIHIYLELFRQNPRDIEVLAALGQICQAVGRPDEARTFYQRALEIEPWNSDLREALQALGSFAGQRI